MIVRDRSRVHSRALRLQLSQGAVLRILRGLAGAVAPLLGSLACSCCGARTTTAWAEGRPCASATGRRCDGAFRAQGLLFPGLREWRQGG